MVTIAGASVQEKKTFQPGEKVWLRRPTRKPQKAIIVGQTGKMPDMWTINIEQTSGTTTTETHSVHFIYRRPLERNEIIKEMHQEIEALEHTLAAFDRETEPEEEEED